ncbi:hypothetical protein KIW84_050860 [Lathyrus oleraceus]|uniref:Uncharacterized protein n=1 Tax=Pisum sativum TaxID=3888 RepID=A0A9D5A9Y5_PEA|nr:hypothetical protein KIW84_050860 [Pisum sativum]
MHHTLDTNPSGSDLIAERALELYLLLKHHPINIGGIIVGDMDEIAHSLKKSLGHAIVILLLCQKVGVANLDGMHMVKPARSLDPFWLKENTMVRVDQSAGVSGPRRPRADDVGLSIPPRKDIPHRVPIATPTVAAEDSQEHFDRMREPSTSYYGLHQYPGIETPIQLGEPGHQQAQSQQSPFQQSPHQQY